MKATSGALGRSRNTPNDHTSATTARAMLPIGYLAAASATALSDRFWRDETKRPECPIRLRMASADRQICTLPALKSGRPGSGNA